MNEAAKFITLSRHLMENTFSTLYVFENVLVIIEKT